MATGSLRLDVDKQVNGTLFSKESAGISLYFPPRKLPWHTLFGRKERLLVEVDDGQFAPLELRFKFPKSTDNTPFGDILDGIKPVRWFAKTLQMELSCLDS